MVAVEAKAHTEKKLYTLIYNIMEKIKKTYPKKHLGQHFLTSRSALLKIVSTGSIEKSDIIVEIGPGKGVLTEILLEKSDKVIAIEKDHELIKLLNEKFSTKIKSKKLTLIEGDILDSKLSFLESSTDENLINKKTDSNKTAKYKVIANIPYYITNAIIRLFLENSNQPTTMVLLVQKEVAERIIAKDKKESLLSISVKIYGEPTIMGKVLAGSFNPPPKVDSAIIKIANISKRNFIEINESIFFKILKAGFAHKRKVLLGNLSLLYKKDKINEVYSKLNIDKKIRAEDLSIDMWKKLTLELEK